MILTTSPMFMGRGEEKINRTDINLSFCEYAEIPYQKKFKWR